MPEYFKEIIFRTLLFIVSHPPRAWFDVSLRASTPRAFAGFSTICPVSWADRALPRSQCFFFLIIEPGTVTRKLQRRSLPCEGRDIILNLFFSGISHGPPARPRCIYFYHGRGVIWRHVYTASVKYGYVDYFFSLSLPCAPVILTEPPSCVDPRFYCAFPFASCSVNAKDRI